MILTRRISLVLKGFVILQPFPLILMNLMFDSGVILLGEIKCLSLVGVKGLFSTSFKCINESPIEMLFDFNFLVSGFGWTSPGWQDVINTLTIILIVSACCLFPVQVKLISLCENEQIFFQLSHFVNHCSVNAGGYLFYYDERPLLKASFLSDILCKKLKVRLKNNIVQDDCF